MLAKVWKKVLLAICIVACIYNVMSKLVNRHSLEENLESANDGVLVFDVFTDNEQPSTSEVIKDAITQMELSNQVTENSITEDGVATEGTDTTGETSNNVTSEPTVTEEAEENKGGFKFSDFTIKF